MNKRERLIFAISAAALALLACLPLADEGFWLTLGISLAGYVAMATAWALFSGPTSYVSLATAAFFGTGAYVVVNLGETAPWPVVLAVAAVAGALLAFLAGVATLRLSGVHFVIFTFGLAELIRQLVTWYQTNVGGSVGQYVFVYIGSAQIYWQLLALCGLVFIVGWAIKRSRLGLALRVIGDDETVAAHAGIDTARVKVLLFCISGAFIAVVGAVLAPRWTYIEPSIAFNSMISFQVVIMALLGGSRTLWGPLVGVLPFTLLYELISGRFPNHTHLLLGVAFLLIVYFLPQGVAGRIAQLRGKGQAATVKTAAVATREVVQ
ncbi:branched-chain amino acid ABC transporter permease [Azoarcus sp. DD4]|uniref:branched-chain amino acid ABC transporter permease n=1 Tax=Azoarcus sp. DD4 TaxID=2027405 RepID=UPI00112BE756|nr:branched-chain amino acid ABC transporter permease [Azoarcus sp. DD4]QDF97809.1 branched-chain amino acid ABC transporter permease [Azoarcus sp. DD4]